MEKDGMEKDIIIMELKNLFLKMEKEKEKNIIIMVYYYLKVNIWMGKEMVKAKNMTLVV